MSTGVVFWGARRTRSVTDQTTHIWPSVPIKYSNSPARPGQNCDSLLIKVDLFGQSEG